MENPLKDAHTALDAAVLKAYGFTAKQDLLAELLKLNQLIAGRIAAGLSVTGPGVPTTYPAAEKLITGDAFGKLILS